jgi:pimeloyl-ACP methyl ester carboxylesterase
MKITELDGVEVIVEGDSGPVVLMLHGWPDTRALWDAQVAA